MLKLICVHIWISVAQDVIGISSRRYFVISFFNSMCLFISKIKGKTSQNSIHKDTVDMCAYLEICSSERNWYIVKTIFTIARVHRAEQCWPSLWIEPQHLLLGSSMTNFIWWILRLRSNCTNSHEEFDW